MGKGEIDLTEIRILASDLGFSSIGATYPLPEVISIFPWARSCLSLALAYTPAPQLLSKPEEPCARVALFASSADYHTVLTEKLSVLSQRIKERSRAQCAICVDTLPIPERLIAHMAGTIWLGRNCCAFAGGAGSFCVLGEIITDLDPPDSVPPLPSLCGDCTRCVEACPTHALRGDGTLDPTRCLSALTQTPGHIPCDLRPLLADRLYGCDTCQEVCPHNASVLHSEPAFAVSRPPGRHPLLIPLLELSTAGFRATLRNSPIGWIGRTRVRRNACIVAGNLRAIEAAPSLRKLATCNTPTLREHAEWALGNIDTR